MGVTIHRTEDPSTWPPQTERCLYLILSLEYSTNLELSEALGVKVRTIESHIRFINQRWGTRNKLQIAAKARELGVLV